MMSCPNLHGSANAVALPSGPPPRKSHLRQHPVRINAKTVSMCNYNWSREAKTSIRVFRVIRRIWRPAGFPPRCIPESMPEKLHNHV